MPLTKKLRRLACGTGLSVATAVVGAILWLTAPQARATYTTVPLHDGRTRLRLQTPGMWHVFASFQPDVSTGIYPAAEGLQSWIDLFHGHILAQPPSGYEDASFNVEYRYAAPGSELEK